MKKLAYVLLGLGIAVSVGVNAAVPTNIAYYKQGKTFFGTEYKVYRVRCSNGVRRDITGWEGNRRWCVGMSRQCTHNQLQTARSVCR
jgi:hypothetical protein